MSMLEYVSTGSANVTDGIRNGEASGKVPGT
jgi:hypothetical protein